MIRIAAPTLAEIEAAARRAHPQEACGLLVGAGESVARAFETANLAAARGHGRDRFEIDARVHLWLQRALRGSGETIVGIFHSHPAGRADPSASDRAAAAYDGWIWLITAVDGAGSCETRAYRDRGRGDFEPCGLLSCSPPRLAEPRRRERG